MPQALPIIFAALVQYGAYYAAAVVFVAMVVSNAHQRRKAARQARDAYNAATQDRLVMTMTTDGPRSRVYGQVRTVDGVLFHATHGTHQEYYTLVVAFAGHECEEIGQIYFDDVPVSFDGSGWITTPRFVHSERVSADTSIVISGGNGSVTLPNTPLTSTVTVSIDLGSDNGTATTEGTVSGNVVTVSGWGSISGTAIVSYEYTSSNPRVRLLQKYLGTSGQDIGSDHLQSRFPSLINTGANDDRFAGICAGVFEFQFDQDVFPTGLPQITAVLKGAKILDPRTNTTAWSQNPALIAYDWARYAYGGGCATTEVITAQVNAAANACDVSTTFNLAAGGSEVRPLYQCGLVCSLDVNPDVWMDEIVESMAGRWGWAGGKIAMVAGAYRAPVETVTEDWISDQGDIEVVPQPSRSELVNVYRPSYFDAAQAYVLAPGSEIRSSSYITIDGQELPREVTLGGVTRAVHAGHVCGVLMRDQREGMVVKLPCNMRAFKLELFDVVSVTLAHFGWNAKPFEIVGWAFDMTKALVTLTCKETDASIYTVDSTFATPNASNNTLLPAPWVVPTPTGLAATSGTTALRDGSIITRTQLTWTGTTSEAVRQSGKIEVQYTEAAAALPATADWPSWLEQGSATKAVIFGLRTKRHYIFRIRAINSLGVRSQWSPLYVHYVAAAPVKVWRQAADPGSSAREGDQWFDTDDGNKHYVREGGAWISVRDSGIAQALADAAAAQSTADGKIKSFYQTTAPTTGMDEGDLWFDTDDGNKAYIRQGGAWVSARDSGIAQALADASDAQATADGKVVTFFGSSTPTATAVGDLWFNNTTGVFSRWSGSAWVATPLGTGGLSSGATTDFDIDTPADASRNTLAWNGASTTLWADHAEVSWTNNTGAAVSVEIFGSCTWEFTGTSTGFQALVKLRGDVNGSPIDTATVPVYDIGTGRREFHGLKAVSVPASQTVTMKISSGFYTPGVGTTGGTISWFDMVLKLNALKR